MYKRFSLGTRIVSWIYDRQLEGKLKWVPIDEVLGFVWMVVIDICLLAFLAGLLLIWLF